MQRLKQKFQDTGGLYARINTYLNHSSVLRVGIIPHNGREQSKTVLEALVSEPVQNTNWNEALKRRPLTKDTLVTQSQSFEYVETHNSLIVYPIPFSGPAVELLEVSNANESKEHIQTCHLILDVLNKKDSLPVNNDVVSEYPRWEVLDGVNAAKDGAININSNVALEANSLLQKSPNNAPQFLELRKKSNIDSLREGISNSKSAYAALRESIINSCQAQIDAITSELKPEDTKTASLQRSEWTELAYAELEGSLMPRLRHLLKHDFAWYKLYLRNDDVSADVSMVAYDMPKSAARYEYLSGLQAASSSGAAGHGLKDAATTTTPAHSKTIDKAITKLQSQSLRGVLTALSVQLPIAACSMALQFMGDFSAYSMVALASLGVVVGFRRLQAKWLKACSEFEETVHDAHVSEIQRISHSLWTHNESRELTLESKIAELKEALAEAKNH